MSVWDRLSGQPRAAAILDSAAAAPGDAYLFTGPSGAGKTEAALAFAAAIICPERCGVCPICRRTFSGLHPDVQIFQPEGLTYPVELIREMVASAARTPLEASRRVMIVEEADRIAERSQNALLKALEEPNRSVTWVLVADALDPFLPTILSRSRVVEFAAVSESAVVSVLQSRFDLDAGEVETIVRAARGDLGRALLLAGDDGAMRLRHLAIDAALESKPSPSGALEIADRVKEQAGEARGALEQDQTEEMARLEENFGPGGWKKRAIDRNRRILRKAENDVFSGFLIWMAEALRDLAAAAAGAGSSDLTIRDRGDEIARAAAARPASSWLQVCEAALAGQLAIVENANPGLVVESVLLRLVAEGPFTLRAGAGVAQG